MPLGTLDPTPPPFFRQGPSALTKLAVCSAAAVFLMVADTRLALTQPLRAAVATVLQPVQRTLLVPVEAWDLARDYLRGLSQAQADESAARADLVRQAERAGRVEQLMAENARLRRLLELRPAIAVRSSTAEVLYEAPDAFSRKVVIDRGSAQGIAPGSPVINEAGVLGQVTRVYPLSAEVTLLTDKEAAIPVLNTRTQARSAAYGLPGGDGMELRFMAGNADVRAGDVLTTSGLDGVYPPGLSVATVTTVDRKSEAGFAHVLLAPSARADGIRHVLVLEPMALQLPARPAPEPEAPKASSAKKGPRK